MIDANDFITRISGGGTNLKLVEGIAEFAALKGANPTVSPACYVMVLDEDPAPNEQGTWVEQRVACRIGVVFAVRSVADATGKAAKDLLQPYRNAVRDLLLGWMPASCTDVAERGKSALLKFQDGYVWWQDSYLTAYYERKN